MHSLHENNRSHFRAYGDPLLEFTTTRDLRQGCTFRLFKFVIGTVMAIALFSSENGPVSICPDSNLSDSEYEHDVMLPSTDPGRLRFCWIVGVTVQLGLLCVLHPQSVKCCCDIVLAWGRTLFVQGNIQMRCMNLVIWLVVTHLMVAYQTKCFRLLRRLFWHPPICDICNVSVIFIIDKISSIRSSCEVSIVLRLRNMAAESRGFANTFGVENRCLRSISRLR